MAQVTDSFCERCGSHYVFSAPVPKPVSIKNARVLAKGLKNFVMTDGQSMSDAMSLARLDEEREDASRIDQAFHRTFNFCMTCRQYACDRCWNAAVGACLTCAPEHSTGPTAPEDHLIVRTPVARWDSDWSLEPDGPAVEPLAHFAGPGEAADSPAEGSTSWPDTDVAASLTRALSHSSEAASGTAQATDPAAWTLWPATNQTAPDMTLTAEELAIVEAELGRTVPAPVTWELGPALEPPAAEPPQLAAEPQLAAVEPPVAEQPQPAAEPEPAALPEFAVQRESSVEPELAEEAAFTVPQELATEQDRIDAGAPAWVARNLEIRPSTPAFAEPDAAGADELVAASSTAEPARDAASPTPAGEPELDASGGIAARASAADAQPGVVQTPAVETDHPPLAAPRSAAHDRAPIVARLLGRQAPAAPTGEPWPHPTAWADRPIQVHDWWGEDATAASADQAAPDEVPTPIVASPAEPAPTSAEAVSAAPAPAPEALSPADAFRSMPGPLSAAAQTSPEPAAPPEPAGDAGRIGATPEPERAHAPEPVQPGLFDLQAAPRQDVAAARANGPDRPQTDLPTSAVRWPAPAVQAPRPATPPAATVPSAPAPWPPLGASWPAPQNPSQAWPAPNAAAVPAVVAAGQLSTPSVSEMWAQSSQEVLNRGSVRACHKCALPVSTHARFCRRCGTQQA